MKYSKFDLEERLINFSVLIIKITKEISQDYPGKHLANQIVRSGTSVSLNYGEAMAAESRKDFIHKIKIILKELRETFVNLKIIHLSNIYSKEENIIKAKSECDELISIFVSSQRTAEKNLYFSNAKSTIQK